MNIAKKRLNAVKKTILVNEQNLLERNAACW